MVDGLAALTHEVGHVVELHDISSVGDGHHFDFLFFGGVLIFIGKVVPDDLVKEGLSTLIDIFPGLGIGAFVLANALALPLRVFPPGPERSPFQHTPTPLPQFVAVVHPGGLLELPQTVRLARDVLEGLLCPVQVAHVGVVEFCVL